METPVNEIPFARSPFEIESQSQEEARNQIPVVPAIKDPKVLDAPGGEFLKNLGKNVEVHEQTHEEFEKKTGIKIKAPEAKEEPKEPAKEVAKEAVKEPEAKKEEPKVEPEAPKKEPVKRKIVSVAKGYPTTQADLDRISDTAAAAATKAVMQHAKAQEKPAPVANEPELSRTEQRRMAVLAQLEIEQPKEYEGIVQRTKKFLASIEPEQKVFQTRWEKANPDENFDSPKERQAKFENEWATQLETIREKSGAVYDQDDFEEAQIALRVKPALEAAKRHEEELAALKQERAVEKTAPVSKHYADAAENSVAKELVGELADKVMKDGKLDAEKLEAEDPEAAPVILKAREDARQFAEVCHKAFSGIANANEKELVVTACKQMEAAIMSSPEEEQRNMDANGRPYMPRDEWRKASTTVQRQYWTMNPEIAIAMENNRILQAAKPVIEAERERFNRILAKRGVAKVESATPPPAEKTPLGNGKPKMVTTTVAPPEIVASKPSTEGNSFYSQLLNGRSSIK